MFNEVNVHSLSINPFEAVGSQWMLITAGNEEKTNTMTASWGNMGIMWNKDITICYIRPQRYTLEFIEREEYYSLCFFGEEKRDALKVCGSVSGRDRDKITECGLTTVFDKEAPYFAEAELVLICKKVYSDVIRPEGFIDASIEKNYAAGDYHKVFMGEIVRCLKKA